MATSNDKQQGSPSIGWAVRNATTLIPERLSSMMLAIICYEKRLFMHANASARMHDLNVTIIRKIAIYVRSKRRQFHKEAKCLMAYKTENDTVESPFPKL